MLYREIVACYNEIKNINYALSLLNWDQSVNIPVNGHQGRASVIETLTKKSYEALTNDLFFDKISRIINQNEFDKLTVFQKKEILKIKKNILRARKIPVKDAAELAKTAALAMNEWAKARESGDDKGFLPLLEKIFDLKVKEANYIGFEKNPYDALLDNFEEGLQFHYIEKIFFPLEEELSGIIKNIKEKGRAVNNDFLFRDFDKDKQREFGLSVVKDMGLEPDSFRLDGSQHPFTTKLGYNDIRITTNIAGNDFQKGFFSTVHEAGHCLFEQRACVHLKESIFSEIDLLALHESQSRFYENIIARSFGFWENYYPILKNVFTSSLNEVPLELFYRAVNKVENNPIRIESDEVTYNLHIILRTALEEKILNGKLKIKDINEAWNEKTFELFGFYPKNKSQGYLQDIHWADGLIGYFPTYTIGNLVASQIYFFMQKELGKFKKIDKEFFKKIFGWFDENIYKYGSEYNSSQVVKRITGDEVDPDYFIKYIKEKFYPLYGL